MDADWASTRCLASAFLGDCDNPARTRDDGSKLAVVFAGHCDGGTELVQPKLEGDSGEGTMRFNDHDYHMRREREHRAQAEAATTEKASLVHLAMADLHAARRLKKAA